MSDTLRRIDALLTQAPKLEKWVGKWDRESLLEWLRLEIGDPTALDSWRQTGSVFSKPVVYSPILHVVSGNTPHAAFQSVFRSLVLGGHNWVKLPSSGLPEFEEWIAELPEELSVRVETRRDLPEAWLECEAAVIFGGAEAIDAYRKRLPGGIPRIEHGPKLSVAVIFEPVEAAAAQVVEDILRHDQRGCLSIQAVFVEGGEAEILSFGGMLAKEMERYRSKNPRPIPSLSDSGAVSNAREIARFRAANGDGVQLWESKNSTAWTVVYDAHPQLAPGPLNGFVTLHPFPKTFDRSTLGSEADYISTVAIFPFNETNAARLESLAPPRICQTGQAQDPTIFWHHDGMRTLASLVRWRDLG
jgi:hypothetical protein